MAIKNIHLGNKGRLKKSITICEFQKDEDTPKQSHSFTAGQAELERAAKKISDSLNKNKR